MQIKNKQDFWSGIMFVVIGAAFALGATSYSMGTAARMGPWLLPILVGCMPELVRGSCHTQLDVCQSGKNRDRQV